jgi:TolA-binding protein
MTVKADSQLNDLRKRKVELDRLASSCAALQDDSKRNNCLADRQKKVDKYKEDLESYKENVAKEAKYQSPDEQNQDYKTSITNRQRSIKEFTDYVNSCTEKSERCASALFQVANLTYQNEEDEFLMKEAQYEKIYQRWEDHDKKGAEPVGPRRDHKNSLALFERFLKDYPTHVKAPEALVRAAFVADMQGNEDRAYEYLNLMVTRWPNHALAVQAHLRLGEYWLLKRKYAKAVEQYEKVPVEYPGNEAGLALYHRAEAYYDMANFEDAAKWYYQYVVLADAGKIKGDLLDEAMSFMAAAWADLDNGFETAEKFLSDKGNPSWENNIFYDIGVKNQGHDRLDEAVKAFRFLLDRDPTYPKAPTADLSIVEILVLQKKAEEAQKARMALVDRYADGSEWFQKNSGNKESVEQAKKAIRLALYSIPVYYHQKGDEGKGDPDMLRKAEEGYRNYLNRYSGEISWEVYQVHQNLAVLYNKLKDYRKSADEWKWCATANTDQMGKLPNDKKGVITKQDAGYNSVVMVDEARKDALKNNYKNDTVAAYRGEETHTYFDFVDWFMGLFGNANAAAEIAYNAAIIHYEAKQYEEAVKHLSDLIAKFPNHEHNVLIRRALAQSLLESGRYDEAEKQFTVLQRKLCPSDKQCPEIKKALASTLFKEAEANHTNHDYAGAGAKFQQMARDFRDVDIADKALFEAGINFDSAGKTEEGVRLLLRIPQDYPKSDLRVKAVLKAASIYMNRQKFRDAAETFILIQKNFPNDSLAIQSIAWAADAYEKGQDLHKSAQTYESSYRLYPKHAKTPGYLYNAGQDYENAKEYGDAISVYRLIGENYPSSQYAAEAVFSVPLLYEKKGEYSKAAVAYEEFTKKYENDKEKLIRAHLGAGRNFENMGN